jgi:hypothetical protein
LLSVSIHKDISNYEPKIISRLTLRTLLCIVGAIGISVLAGMYCTVVLAMGSSEVTYVSMTLSIPFWALGFLRPGGMKFEVYMKYWLEFNTQTKKLYYVPTAKKAGLINDPRKEVKAYEKDYRKLTSQPGIEACSPKAGRVL